LYPDFEKPLKPPAYVMNINKLITDWAPSISKVKWTFITMSVVLLVLSFTQTPFKMVKDEGEIQYSLLLFLFGWVGIFFGSFSTISWLANPLLVFSWISSTKNNGISIFASVFSTLLALFFLGVKEMVGGSETPSSSQLVVIGAGYWLWLSSIIVFTIGTFVINMLQNNIDGKGKFEINI
jgi:glucan phosphoethanolaminetransferase (alkaline phosphatase superfamily)